MANAQITLSPVVDNEGYFIVRFASLGGSVSTLAFLLSFDENSHIHPDSNGLLAVSQVTESLPSSSATVLTPDPEGFYNGSFCRVSLTRYPSITIEYDDSAYLCSSYPLVHVSSSNLSIVNTLFGGSSGGSSGGSNVDLSSITSSLNSIFSSLNSLSDQIYHLDLQVPDDLNDKLQTLSSQVSNLDLSTIGNLFNMGVSLNGNGSRYKDGLEVKVSKMVGTFKVLASVHSRAEANIYTVIYKLQRIEEGGSLSDVHFVPEALVYLESETPAVS